MVIILRTQEIPMTETPKNLIQAADTPETLYGYRRIAANGDKAPPPAKPACQQQQRPTTLSFVGLNVPGTKPARTWLEEQQLLEEQARAHDHEGWTPY